VEEALTSPAHRGEVSTPKPRPVRKEKPRPAHAQAPRTGGRQLSIMEAAAYLGVSERLLRRLIAERRIPHQRLGRLIRLSRADLDAYLHSCRVEPLNPPDTR
jgi:excisionase family DNA binding protein